MALTASSSSSAGPIDEKGPHAQDATSHTQYDPHGEELPRPTGWKYRARNVGPLMLPYYASPRAQLLVVSFVCFLCPGMFNAIRQVVPAVDAIPSHPSLTRPLALQWHRRRRPARHDGGKRRKHCPLLHLCRHWLLLRHDYKQARHQARPLFWRPRLLHLHCLAAMLHAHAESRLRHLRRRPARRLRRSAVVRTGHHHAVLPGGEIQREVYLVVLDDLQPGRRHR